MRRPTPSRPPRGEPLSGSAPPSACATPTGYHDSESTEVQGSGSAPTFACAILPGYQDAESTVRIEEGLRFRVRFVGNLNVQGSLRLKSQRFV